MLYVISGCSCGGKTTLINALVSQGHTILKEPGRAVVREELDGDGGALPWNNPVEFAVKCLEISVKNHDDATRLDGIVFFDRSLVDAVSALVHVKPGLAKQYMRMLADYRYADTVFIAPPWPEIYENDAERKHTFEDSVAEYDRLVTTYSEAGYNILTLPKSSVPDRVNFIYKQID